MSPCVNYSWTSSISQYCIWQWYRSTRNTYVAWKCIIENFIPTFVCNASAAAMFFACFLSSTLRAVGRPLGIVIAAEGLILSKVYKTYVEGKHHELILIGISGRGWHRSRWYYKFQNVIIHVDETGNNLIKKCTKLRKEEHAFISKLFENCSFW